VRERERKGGKERGGEREQQRKSDRERGSALEISTQQYAAPQPTAESVLCVWGGGQREDTQNGREKERAIERERPLNINSNIYVCM